MSSKKTFQIKPIHQNGRQPSVGQPMDPQFETYPFSQSPVPSLYLPYSARRISQSVTVGKQIVGGNAPIVVQAMTNTDTSDVEKTAQQIQELAQAGAELVRITVNNHAAAKAVPYIADRLQQRNCVVPLIGDFHYNGDQLLRDYPACALRLAKYRINPGNAGVGDKKNRSFATFVEIALKYHKPIRIGVNWGSLDQQVLQRLMDNNAQLNDPAPAYQVMRSALCASALESAAFAESMGLPHNQIILSCKVSQAPDLMAVYRELANRCDYPLHLGLTEAGLGDKGIVLSSVSIGSLLTEGIGDTIRVSLTPFPGDLREREVKIAQEILQSLGLRTFSPTVIACPGCGRTTSVFFQELADVVQQHLRQKMPLWHINCPDVVKMKVAVMGCVVNGPGESKHADIGISLPGTGEKPAAPVFMDGKHVITLRGDNIAQQFLALIDTYVHEHYQKVSS